MQNKIIFELTKKAKEDLRNIAIYTQNEWGVNQRNLYLKQIDNAFNLLAKSSKNKKSCDYIKIGYYKKSIGKHIIFYRILNRKIVQIVRILHESMDIQSHL